MAAGNSAFLKNKYLNKNRNISVTNTKKKFAKKSFIDRKKYRGATVVVQFNKALGFKK